MARKTLAQRAAAYFGAGRSDMWDVEAVNVAHRVVSGGDEGNTP